MINPICNEFRLKLINRLIKSIVRRVIIAFVSAARSLTGVRVQCYTRGVYHRLNIIEFNDYWYERGRRVHTQNTHFV